MKAYIISFYQQEVSDDELVAFLDERREILNWLKPFPGTVFVVSNKNASSVAKFIRKEFPESFFIVAEYLSYNSDGLLTEDMWDFLNDPEEAKE